MPSFSSVRETVNPGTLSPFSSLRSTMNNVMPSWRASGSVLATSRMKSARAPFVMKIFDPLITYSSPSRTRRRPDAGDVGAGPRLGDAEAGDLLALDPGNEVALLEILGAEQLDRGEHHVGVDREPHAEAAGARVGEALGADQRVVVVAALPAVLLGEAEPDVTELGHPVQDRIGPVVLLVFLGVGGDLLLDPGLHRLAQILVLVGEDQVLAPGLELRLDHVACCCGHRSAPSLVESTK